MRCSFCAALDSQGLHHHAPRDAAAVCPRCLAAIDAALRGVAPPTPYSGSVSLLTVVGSGPPKASPLSLPPMPCAWCGTSDRAGVAVAELLGVVSLCAPCAGSLRARERSAAVVHYRQSPLGDGRSTDVVGARYRLDGDAIHRVGAAEDDVLPLSEVRGIQVRVWPAATRNARWTYWVGGLMALAAIAGVAVGWSNAVNIAVVAFGLAVLVFGRGSDELRLELLREDGTTFELDTQRVQSDVETLVARHARVLTAALSAMGRSPAVRLSGAPSVRGVRIDAGEEAEGGAAPTSAEATSRRRKG